MCRILTLWRSIVTDPEQIGAIDAEKIRRKIFKQVMADIGALGDASKHKVLAYLKRHISSDGLTVEGFIKDLRDKRFR